MGIAKGRFVIDTHVHAQRAAIKWQDRGLKPDWVALSKLRAESQAYDSTPRLLYDMEKYGVDMCVLNPYLNPSIDIEIVKKYPNKFVLMYGGAFYNQKVKSGKVKWSIKGLCKDLDEQLSTGLYVAIGEGMPGGFDREGFSFSRRHPDVQIAGICCYSLNRSLLSPEVTANHAHFCAIVVNFFRNLT